MCAEENVESKKSLNYRGTEFVLHTWCKARKYWSITNYWNTLYIILCYHKIVSIYAKLTGHSKWIIVKITGLVRFVLVKLSLKEVCVLGNRPKIYGVTCATKYRGKSFCIIKPQNIKKNFMLVRSLHCLRLLFFECT